MVFTRPSSGAQTCAGGQDPTDFPIPSAPWTHGFEEGLGNWAVRDLLVLNSISDFQDQFGHQLLTYFFAHAASSATNVIVLASTPETNASHPCVTSSNGTLPQKPCHYLPQVSPPSLQNFVQTLIIERFSHHVIDLKSLQLCPFFDSVLLQAVACSFLFVHSQHLA